MYAIPYSLPESATYFTSHHTHFGATLQASAGERMKVFMIVLGMVVIAVAGMAAAQSSRPQFEVASVKPNTSGDNRMSVDAAKGRFSATNVSLRNLLRYAYDPHLPEDEMRRATALFSATSAIQIIGGPSWIGNDRFDVEAKPGGDHPIAQGEMQLMLQSLLEDRFQLKAHYEMREVPTYNLVVAKEGKLKVSSDKNPASGKPMPPLPLGRATVLGRPTASGMAMTFYGRAITISTLVTSLESWAGKRITDKTNFKGTFDVLLEFSPQQSTATVVEQGVTPSPADPSGPSLFTVIVAGHGCPGHLHKDDLCFPDSPCA
jgi:uncharacterized protein (TIGR03435 family)